MGKTTIIKRALASYQGPAGGFYTEEVRQNGLRIGFDIVTLEGHRAPLARVGLAPAPMVGKYGVDVASLEEVAVPALWRAMESGATVVVDEIGKMELTSPKFREAVQALLDSGRRLLGTIMLARHPWADGIKRDPRVAVIGVTRENREEVRRRVEFWLLKGGNGRP